MGYEESKCGAASVELSQACLVASAVPARGLEHHPTEKSLLRRSMPNISSKFGRSREDGRDAYGFSPRISSSSS